MDHDLATRIRCIRPSTVWVPALAQDCKFYLILLDHLRHHIVECSLVCGLPDHLFNPSLHRRLARPSRAGIDEAGAVGVRTPWVVDGEIEVGVLIPDVLEVLEGVPEPHSVDVHIQDWDSL